MFLYPYSPLQLNVFSCTGFTCVTACNLIVFFGRTINNQNLGVDQLKRKLSVNTMTDVVTVPE